MVTAVACVAFLFRKAVVAQPVLPAQARGITGPIALPTDALTVAADTIAVVIFFET